MKDTQGKLATWVWENVSHPIAYWMVGKVITRYSALTRILFYYFPVYTALVYLLEDSMLCENIFIWYWDGTPTEDVEDLLEDIHQHIPYGGDDYFVIATRLDAIPGEENGVDPGKLDDSLSLRRALITDEVAGNRWRDWKRGEGRQQGRSLLEQARPNPESPIAVIFVLVYGHAILRPFGLACTESSKIK